VRACVLRIPLAGIASPPTISPFTCRCWPENCCVAYPASLVFPWTTSGGCCFVSIDSHPISPLELVCGPPLLLGVTLGLHRLVPRPASPAGDAQVADSWECVLDSGQPQSWLLFTTCFCNLLALTQFPSGRIHSNFLR